MHGQAKEAMDGPAAVAGQVDTPAVDGTVRSGFF